MKRKLDLLSRVVVFIVLCTALFSMFRLTNAVKSLKPADPDPDAVEAAAPLDLRADIVRKVAAREAVEDQYLLLVDDATASKLERYNYCTAKLHDEFTRRAVKVLYEQRYPDYDYQLNAQTTTELYAVERDMVARFARCCLYRRPAEYMREDDLLCLLTCVETDGGPAGSWLDSLHENVEMPLNRDSMEQYFSLCDDIILALK